MGGFDHRPASSEEDRSRLEPTRHSRAGLVLFAIYLFFYASFVLANAFAPTLMARTPWAGINLAVLSGLALIVMAFVLAVLYDWICRLGPARDDSREAGR
ncbi:MAG: DUF485 domain-containing protein [Pirellulales bacterium]|nr:DUF485 domain-containing protein [Pirellulales bacterium]